MNQLWLQDKVMKGEVEVSKVSTGNNLADALTKHVEGDILGKHMRVLGVSISSGRHSLMPEVAEN